MFTGAESITDHMRSRVLRFEIWGKAFLGERMHVTYLMQIAR